MGTRLNAWLDEECRDMRLTLLMTPTRDHSRTEEMVAEFREAMKRSYCGQCLLLADQFEELWETLPRWLRLPAQGWARILRVTRR